jgi:hypothetical protein
MTSLLLSLYVLFSASSLGTHAQLYIHSHKGLKGTLSINPVSVPVSKAGQFGVLATIILGFAVDVQMEKDPFKSAARSMCTAIESSQPECIPVLEALLAAELWSQFEYQTCPGLLYALCGRLIHSFIFCCVLYLQGGKPLACLQGFLQNRGLNDSAAFASEFSRRAVNAAEVLGHVPFRPLEFSVTRWFLFWVWIAPHDAFAGTRCQAASAWSA